MFDDYYSYSTLRPQFITRISRLVKLFLLWLFLCEAMTGRRHSAAFERELIGLLKSLNEETNGLFLFLKISSYLHVIRCVSLKLCLGRRRQHALNYSLRGDHAACEFFHGEFGKYCL